MGEVQAGERISYYLGEQMDEPLFSLGNAFLTSLGHQQWNNSILQLRNMYWGFKQTMTAFLVANPGAKHSSARLQTQLHASPPNDTKEYAPTMDNLNDMLGKAKVLLKHVQADTPMKADSDNLDAKLLTKKMNLELEKLGQENADMTSSEFIESNNAIVKFYHEKIKKKMNLDKMWDLILKMNLELAQLESKYEITSEELIDSTDGIIEFYEDLDNLGVSHDMLSANDLARMGDFEEELQQMLDATAWMEMEQSFEREETDDGMPNEAISFQ